MEQLIRGEMSRKGCGYGYGFGYGSGYGYGDGDGTGDNCGDDCCYGCRLDYGHGEEDVVQSCKSS